MDMFTEKANKIVSSLNEYAGKEKVIYQSEDDEDCSYASEDAETPLSDRGDANVVNVVSSLQPNQRNPKIAQTQQQVDKLVQSASRILQKLNSQSST
jgi:hypothetical protein